MGKQFTIGQKLNNGIIIIDGPFKTNQKNNKYLVKCPSCQEKSIKWSNTLNKLVYGCKKCYNKSMRKVEDKSPAVNKAYQSLKANAKSRNITVEISKEEFYRIASKNCYWCDEPPSIKNPPKNWQRQVSLSGIDRVDNKTGYTLNNSVACCYNCNRAKSDLPLDVWLYWLQMISKKHCEKSYRG